MYEWRCTVCNYLHKGDEPPARCPVCGADRSKFVKVTEDERPAGSEPGGPGLDAAEERRPDRGRSSPILRLLGFVREQLVKNRAHPISVHIPNGVLPAAAIFLLAGLVCSHAGLKSAAFYNLILVVLAMPMVFFSGYLDWKARYGGVYTATIVTKIVCAVIVFGVGIVLVLWGSFSSTVGWPFLLFHLIMLAAAGIAGYMGGKLVFGNGRGR